MKAIDFPSGDQTGDVARSVPVSWRASIDLSSRSHSDAGPPAAPALNTTYCPSGDTALPE